jgi:hypothetical protein
MDSALFLQWQALKPSAGLSTSALTIKFPQRAAPSRHRQAGRCQAQYILLKVIFEGWITFSFKTPPAANPALETRQRNFRFLLRATICEIVDIELNVETLSNLRGNVRVVLGKQVWQEGVISCAPYVYGQVGLEFRARAQATSQTKAVLVEAFASYET